MDNLTSDHFARSMMYGSVISPARRQIACERAVKEKGSFDDIVVKGNFCGFPRAGKSSFKDRLVGRFCTTSASTGVAEKVVRVEVNSVVYAGEQTWQQVDTLSDETALMSSKVSVIISGEPTTIPVEKKNRILKNLQIVADKTKLLYKRVVTTRISIPQVSPPLTSNVTPQQAIESSTQHPTPATTTTAKQGATSLKSSDKKWTLYMSDVGGQPEFQELFPRLLFGPSLFFYIMRADQDLNATFPVEYLHSSGKSMVPYETSTTTRESILQFLSSITLIGAVEGRIERRPKVLFIATHIDQLKTNIEDKIQKIDKELQQLVKGTQAYKDKMIIHGSESRMLLAVNNKSEDDGNFQKVRSVVEDVVTSSDDYRITFPYTWAIFSFTIQHHPDQVIPYSTCREIAKECGIDTDKELDDCLWFLHHQTGILRHFSDIPELRDKVFKDTQYIFDSVSELIINTFTFQQTGRDMVTVEEFTKKGIFSLESFQKLYSKTEHLSPAQLLKLLEYLHFVAPLNKGSVSSKYFLPCSLVHAEIKTVAESSPDWLPSLHYTFDSGYCPKGLFGALVANLLHGSQQDYEWIFEEDQIFRDQISFSVGPYLDRFQFTVTSSYISIEVFPSEVQDRPLANVCCHVRQHISTNLVEVTRKLNYDPLRTPHRLAFQCLNKTCNAAIHSAIIKFNDEKFPTILKCPYSPKPVSLPKNHQIWFDKHYDAVVFTKSQALPTSTVAEACENDIQITRAEDVKSPTLSSLTLIKWKDAHGELHRFKLMEQISDKWSEMGTLLGLTQAQLRRFKEVTLNDPEKSCKEVFSFWLEGQETSRSYPKTWRGMYVLLEDVDCANIAEDLKNILKSVATSSE